jgi:hypothetical protein
VINTRVEVRPATVEDLSAVNDIYNQYVAETHYTFDVEPMSSEARREWFTHYNTLGRYRVVVAQAARLLGERIVALAAMTEKLTRIMGELRTAGVTRLALIELEHKIAMLEAEGEWVRKLEREITNGKLEWKAGIDSGHEVLRSRHGSSAH